MKIDGDTVTVSFEMRSGREHNTPDKAIWGFKVAHELIFKMPKILMKNNFS